MSNNLTPASLFLCPVEPGWNTRIATLTKTLRSIGLIENKIPDKPNSFYAGRHFLNLITFLGCSPSIQFDASGEKPQFCFIRLIVKDKIQMIHTNKQARSPQCPHCNKSVKQWNDFDIDALWHCPHCDQSSHAHEYNWKHTAGIAQCFIEITDIYPKEAIPQPIFLERLSVMTGVGWDYFYCAG